MGVYSGKVVYEDKVIIGDEILTIRIIEIINAGMDGEKYGIELVDYHGNPKYNRTVGVSGTFRGTYHLSDEDLVRLIAQFRETLPDVITSENTSAFGYPAWSRNENIHRIGALLQVFFRRDPDGELEPDYIRNSVTIEFGEILSILEYFERNEIVEGVELGSNSVQASKGWEQRLQNILQSLERKPGGDPLAVGPPAALQLRLPAGLACQKEMHDGQPCGRGLADAGHCICHSMDRQKDSVAFARSANVIFQDTREYDFTGFVFPEDYQFPDYREFKRPLIFDRAVFRNFVQLENRIFKAELFLNGCEFEGGGTFARCVFEKNVEMRRVKAKALSFAYSRFLQGLLLENNIQWKARFASIDFSWVIFEDTSKIFLRNIFLPQMRFEGCDLTSVSFVGVQPFEPAIWGVNAKSRTARFNRWFSFKMGKIVLGLRPLSFEQGDITHHASFSRVGDEFVLEKDLQPIKDNMIRLLKIERVAECYQKLQRNMLAGKNYPAASRFHLREMELLRQNTWKFWKMLGFRALYRHFSNYGESAWRPLIIFMAMLVLVPGLLMFCLGESTYQWTGNFSDLSTGLGGWFEDFVSNLRGIVYLKNDFFGAAHGDFGSGWHLLFIAEKLISVLLVSFVVVALRRRFRRY